MRQQNISVILLVIGILGIASGIYGIVKGQSYSDYAVGLICGSALILGAYNINQEANKKED